MAKSGADAANNGQAKIHKQLLSIKEFLKGPVSKGCDKHSIYDIILPAPPSTNEGG